MPPPLNVILPLSFSKPLTWYSHISRAAAVVEDDHGLLHDVEHWCVPTKNAHLHGLLCSRSLVVLPARLPVPSICRLAYALSCIKD